ncbi:hypothetical protein TWF730_002637 [Orbilia blumenaviensis]|uniref:F-box domain-containing protein n=1 Tax=Orbilia blumenaviensis TaxID=1796055 RepID=A0AAV9UBB7_9PEZI
MASLSAICAIRELSYEIIQYLSPSDIFSLLLTCKLFYPVCYQSLWSTLRLYDKAKINDRGRICHKLSRLINARGVDNTGIQHIRTVLLHRYSLTCTNGFVRSGFIHVLEELLKNGKLNLKHLDLRYNLSWHTDSEKEELFGFLRHLREYSQRRQPDEFSMAVTANPISLEPGLHIQILDIGKITSLDLEMDWWYGGSDNDERPHHHHIYTNGLIPGEESDSDFTDPGDSTGDLSDEEDWPCSTSDQPTALDGSRLTGLQIDTSQQNTRLAGILTHLLSQTTNLRFLTIRSIRDAGRQYTDFKLSPPLRSLQTTIKKLPRLHTLTIQGKFFHPSFFVAPPESAKVVSYDGLVSNRWLRGFRECQFTNVTHLKIKFRKDIQERGKGCRDFRRRPVNYVQVSGLLQCNIEGSDNIAPDLELCLLRANPQLGEMSKRTLSKRAPGLERPV